MYNLPENYSIGIGAPQWIHAAGPWLFVLVAWSLFWKGLALWHSARRGQPWWFFFIFIVNTAGILEIIYLFGVAKKRFSNLFAK